LIVQYHWAFLAIGGRSFTLLYTCDKAEATLVATKNAKNILESGEAALEYSIFGNALL
jgi:hypothetical protein